VNNKYGTEMNEVLSLVNTLRSIKDLENAPAVSITLPATVFKHLLDLQATYSRRITCVEDTKANRELYAQYVQGAISKGKSDDQIDGWETWARRKASIAFVLTHTKNETTGEWSYNPKGEILLTALSGISNLTDEVLKPSADALNEELLAVATAILA
jgi:hypothetical protein